MTVVDDFGNTIVRPVGSILNGEIDTEYTPDPDRRVSAQQQQFEKVNEAIGLLQYNAEQDSERIDDLLVRVEKLEAAQPKPVPDNYAHIPIDEWLDFKEELEGLRAFKAAHA